MANHKSALRQWRRGLKKNTINRSNMSMLRTQIKELREAIKNNNKQEAMDLLPQAFSVIDRSIKKGTIKENKGNRYKSRLSHQVELITASSPK